MLRPGKTEHQLPGDSTNLFPDIPLTSSTGEASYLARSVRFAHTFPATSRFSHTDEEFLHAEPPIFFELLQCESGIPILDRFYDLLMLVNGNVDQRKLPHIEKFVSPYRQPQPLNGILQAAIRTRSQECFMPAIVQNESAFWVPRSA